MSSKKSAMVDTPCLNQFSFIGMEKLGLSQMGVFLIKSLFNLASDFQKNSRLSRTSCQNLFEVSSNSLSRISGP